MRGLIVMSMFVASMASATWNEYSETRELELAADGISLLDIDAGAGAIEIRGDSKTTNIQVTATIKLPKLDDDDDVEHDLIIVDDGSGSLQLSDIRGSVHRDD